MPQKQASGGSVRQLNKYRARGISSETVKEVEGENQLLRVGL